MTAEIHPYNHAKTSANLRKWRSNHLTTDKAVRTNSKRKI
jgi:hypothetical protein